MHVDSIFRRENNKNLKTTFVFIMKFWLTIGFYFIRKDERQSPAAEHFTPN